MRQRPVHLLVKFPTNPLRSIACGTPVGPDRGGYTDDANEASCYACARYAPGLQEPQRDDIRNNARRRLGRPVK